MGALIRAIRESWAASAKSIGALALPVIAVTLFALACKGGDGESKETSGSNTPSPTATATVQPTTPTPGTGASGVEVVDLHAGTDDSEGLNFLGEVTNNGNANATNIRIAVTLTDAEGNVVGTGTGLADAQRVLRPREKIPFELFVENPPESWEEETVEVQADLADETDRAAVYSGLKLTDISFTPNESGGITVGGKVENIGGGKTGSVKVTFAAYDSDLRLQALASTFSDPDQIAPGGAAPFELLVVELDDVPDSHRIIVEGSPQ